MKKKTFKTILDILMTTALPVLMAYSLVGETLHEIVGSAMLVLFITHHILNRKSTTVMFRGKQTPVRSVNTTLNILLFAVMILLPVSGIVMSKHLYTFLPTFGISATARVVHLLLSYWGFVLLSLHLGLHTGIWFHRIRASKSVRIVLSAVLIFVSAYGIYAFVQRKLTEYLFLRTQFVFFDFDEPLFCFFGDYVTIMALFAVSGYVLRWALRKTDTN